MTSADGIFAAGDAVYGTKSVVQAIASGRDAASAIDKYLGGDGDISEILAPQEIVSDWIGKEKGFADKKREKIQIMEVEKRKHSFCEMDFGFGDDSVCKEAGRCLQCDLRLRIAQPRLWGNFESAQEEA